MSSTPRAQAAVTGVPWHRVVARHVRSAHALLPTAALCQRHDVCGVPCDGLSRDWRRYMQRWLRKHPARHINLLVAVPSTPAQYFHLLRRQVLSPFPKPLACLTPKSIMHHGPCQSLLSDMGPGTEFQPVIPHEQGKHDAAPQDVRRVLMCTGQVYYALRNARRVAKAHVRGV